MRAIFGLMLFVCFFASANAAFKSQEDLSEWVTYYYVNPEPSQLPDAIEYMSKAGWLDNEKSIPPVFGFLAGVFRDNPEHVSGWIDRLGNLTDSHLRVVALGLWYAGLPESQKSVYELLEKHTALKKELSFLYQGAPMLIEEIPLEQGAWVLDALWGNFMATGDKGPVVRIMSTLPWIDIRGDLNRMVIGGAARWSLTSNAVQHERIMEYCKGELKSQPDDIAGKLREVIENAKKELEDKRDNSIQPKPQSSADDG